MKEQVMINNKWIEANKASFQETLDEATGKKKLYLQAKIVPFGEKSRNGVLYNKKSIEETYQKLVGKTLNHNHVTNGEKVYPRGKWVSTELRADGMYGVAEVFQTEYNKDYIEWLKADNEPRVSLQVTGGAKSIKEEKTNTYYREATITDWLESSTVVIPGFDSAKANFEVALAEAFTGEELSEEYLFESSMNDIQNFINELTKKGTSEKDIIKEVIKKYRIDKDDVKSLLDEGKESIKEDHLKVGDLVDLAGVKVKILQVTNNGYVVEEVDEPSSEEEKAGKEYPKENFFKQLNSLRKGF
jgi:hypothetical protein